MRRSSSSSLSSTHVRRTISPGRRPWPRPAPCRRYRFSGFPAGSRPTRARSTTTTARNSGPAGRANLPCGNKRVATETPAASARRRGAENRADYRTDQHRDELQRDPVGRGQIDVDADQKSAGAAEYEPELRAVHAVGFLQVVCLMQLAQGHPSLGEEVHVTIFDPREQQIVGRLDGAAQIGQQEVQSASHAGSPLTNTTV